MGSHLRRDENGQIVGADREGSDIVQEDDDTQADAEAALRWAALRR